MTRSRIYLCSLFLLIPVFIVSPVSLADEQAPVCKLGAELREATGFGPMVLAALGVDAQTHAAIAGAADAYCETNRQTVEPLLVALRTARQEAMKAIEKNEDVATKEAAVADAMSSLRTAASSVVTTMRSHLTQDQQARIDQWAANARLDAPLCLLDLTSQQRQTLLAAQIARDLVALHPKMRKNIAAVNTARATFEDVVTATLTQEQQATLASFKTALRENLVTILQREESRCSD